MIRHILKTGKEVNDIRGHIVRDSVISDLLRKMEEGNGKKEQDEEVNPQSNYILSRN